DAVAEVERRREVLDLAGGEQQRPLAVDGHPEQRQETGVLGEQPGRGAVDVADLVADAERRALEDRERHYSSRRTNRAPLDCRSALTTISSMFTCSGRVTANRMQSAMSDAVSGSIPLYTAFACSTSPRKRITENSVSTAPASTVEMRIGRPRKSSRSA